MKKMTAILFKISRSHGKLWALAPVWMFPEAENVRIGSTSKPNSHLLICHPSAEDKTTHHTYNKTVLESSQEGDKEFKVFALGRHSPLAENGQAFAISQPTYNLPTPHDTFTWLGFVSVEVDHWMTDRLNQGAYWLQCTFRILGRSLYLNQHCKTFQWIKASFFWIYEYILPQCFLNLDENERGLLRREQDARRGM